jgi:hypothetical protein
MTPEMEAAKKEAEAKELNDKMAEQLQSNPNIRVNVKRTKAEDTIDKILGHSNSVANEMNQKSIGFYGVRSCQEIPKRYRTFSGKYVTQTDKAVLFQQGGLSKWIPKSQMCILAGTEKSTPVIYASSWILGKIGF